MAIKRILSSLIAILLPVCIVFPTVQIGAVFAYAENNSFDSANVLDDLLSSTVNGKPFEITKYTFNEKGSLQIINVVEYCYSYSDSKKDDYGLYIYLYNPQGINYDTTSKQNKIQLAVNYNSSGTPTKYEKFNLKFCSKSETENYKNLFYKYKIIDKKIDDTYIYDRVNANERRYDISGIEMLIKNSQNATEYTVGGTYKFSGYTKGYGPDEDTETDLTCTVENRETLELSVQHTYYRTNVSALGKDHYNQVSTVYFSVPDRMFQTYGNLQKIRAQWWEYKTKMATITSDYNFYNQLMQYTGVNVGEYNSDVPIYLYTGFESVVSTQIGVPSICNYDWTYNVNLSPIKSIFGTTTMVHLSKNTSSIMPYAFYTPTASVDGIFNFLFSNKIAGNVEATEVANWIYNYSNSLGNGSIDCCGRAISKDLFESTVDAGRTRGFNDKTIDLSDTFNLESYDSNHSWWDKLWDYGFSWPSTNGDYRNVSPIYCLQSSDLSETNKNIADNLLVNENDVSDLKSYFTTETAKGNRVILFRFASTDYYSAPAFRNGLTGGIESTDTYVAQQTVFLDFDIIELTFHKNGEYYVIPVVSSPIDIVNEFTAPAEEFEWWKIIVALLFLVLLVIVLIPIMPYIIKGIVGMISLPIKGVKSIIAKFKQIKQDKAENKKKEK